MLYADLGEQKRRTDTQRPHLCFIESVTIPGRGDSQETSSESRVPKRAALPEGCAALRGCCFPQPSSTKGGAFSETQLLFIVHFFVIFASVSNPSPKLLLVKKVKLIHHFGAWNNHLICCEGPFCLSGVNRCVHMCVHVCTQYLPRKSLCHSADS